MRFNSGFWRKCRFALRCLRYTVWALALMGLFAFAWFNLIGLPNFLKSRLTAALHARGFDLEFSRMRLRPVHGFIAENVLLGGTNNLAAARFTAKEIQLRLAYTALLHGKIELAGLVLHHGELTLPATNNALVISNLESRLYFLPADTWSLTDLTAQFIGVKFQLNGEVSHARELKNWPLFSGKKTDTHPDRAAQLAQLAGTLAKIKFTGQPQFNLTLNGDALDFHTFSVRLNLSAPEVQTPWLNAEKLNGFAPLTAPTNVAINTDETWGFWTNLSPFQLAWTLRADQLKLENIKVGAVEISGGWNAPELFLHHCSAQFGDGQIALNAHLNVATRQLAFTNDSHFELQNLTPLLASKIRERLPKTTWKFAPQFAFNGSLRLPPWWEKTPDWRSRIQTNLFFSGALNLTNANFGAVKMDSFQTHFAFSNSMFTLPECQLTQGKTHFNVQGKTDARTKDFSAQLTGNFDIESARPFLTTSNAVRGFSHLALATPLALDLAIAGNLRDFTRLTANGKLALTNFSIREQNVEWLTAQVNYSNWFATFLTPKLARANGSQTFSATQITLDIVGQKLILTNGEAVIDPMVVARAIGPKTAAGAEPYHFLAVPHLRVNGCVPLKQKYGELVVDDADLSVEVAEETPFRWRKFETPRISGMIHWWKDFIIVTNTVSECYGGTAHGWGNFNVRTEGEGTDFNFFLAGTNVDFHRMGVALWSPTNQLAGALSGEVNVTSANSSDWRTWNGFGNAELQNGLLWDVPVVGLVSSALNTVTPGLSLGNSRATEANGTFAMTNGVIFTDTLDIRSLTMRLQYIGTVDLEQRVNARATAQLFRNVPLFGWLVSTALSPVSKMFECQVTGTLGKPNPQPIYVPKILLAPLHPIHAVEGIFTAPPTNPPPIKK